MKKFFIPFVALCALTSCYGDYVMDYDYTAAYAAFQYDLRTFVCGEDVEVGFTTALGGVISNNRDRKVDVVIDNTLLSSDLSVFDPAKEAASFTALDGLLGNAPLGTLSQDYVSKEVRSAGITKLEALPESYYTTSGDVTIKKGYHTGDLFLYPTDAMFADVKTLKPYYALAFKIQAADTDTIVDDKAFEIIAIKVENRFWGYWYHGGRRVVTSDADGSEVSSSVYAMTIPQAETALYTLTTEGFSSVTTDKFSNENGSLRLTFLTDGTVQVEDLGGGRTLSEISGKPSHHNGAKLIQNREIYLNYAYPNGDGTTTYVTDTLAFRNRIRDGINEWQDENSNNY